MDKILHISVVLLGVLWLICDLYALENNTTPNYGWFDFYFNDPYSSSSSDASRGSSTNPYTVEATSPSARTKPGENNSQQNKQDAPRNNQSLPENTGSAELKTFLQLLLSALNSLNPDAEKQKDENPKIKTSNPVDNQTERTTDMKRGNSDAPDDVEFENFSGDDENYYYEDDPVYNKADNNTTPKPTNNNLRKGNPDNETQTPADVTEIPPVSNFDFNRFSTPSTHIPQVKTEQSEIKFTYNYRNVPVGSSVNHLPTRKPINVLIPPKIENKMYETFIPYPFQRNNPENGFPFEYVPASNLFANSYFIPNPFVDTNSNIPVDENINQPSYQQTPTMPGESKVFDPYIQYNQRYIPNIPYLSEYIPIPLNKPPDRNENSPNIANLPESHNPIANASEQYIEAKPTTSNTTPRNTPNTKTYNYNFQAISTNNRNPKLAPTVSSMIYILKNNNSPQKNESEKFPNIPNAVYAKPGSRQPPLTSLQKTKPLNTTTNAYIPVQIIRYLAPNLTDYNSKLPDKIPKLDNDTVSNFTVPNQSPQQTILNKSNSSLPVENSTAPSNINTTTELKPQFVTEQTVLNQTLGIFYNSDNFPKNQSFPAGRNINPFNPKGEAPQFNDTEILLPLINNTNGNSTANPRNNVTEVSGERNVSRNFPPKEQQTIKPIPLYIPTFPFFNTSLPEPENPYQPDSYPYEYNDAYEPYVDYDDGASLNGLLDLLKFMQEMMNNGTVTQTPQNTSASTTTTTSSVLQTTPSTVTAITSSRLQTTPSTSTATTSSILQTTPSTATATASSILQTTPSTVTATTSSRLQTTPSTATATTSSISQTTPSTATATTSSRLQTTPSTTTATTSSISQTTPGTATATTSSRLQTTPNTATATTSSRLQTTPSTATATTSSGLQTTQNRATATTSSILQTTPSNETKQIMPQNISSPHTNLSIDGLLNPINPSKTIDYFKPNETFGSMLEYIFRYSNNPLFISLKAPGNVTTQN